MNTIEKQKKALIILGVVVTFLALASLIIGIVLITLGAKDLTTTSGILKFTFGMLLTVIAIPLTVAGVKYMWVGGYLKATHGSIKEGNIAKEGGTVNMHKCDKCGTEIQDGETVCSNCGKEVE